MEKVNNLKQMKLPLYDKTNPNMKYPIADKINPTDKVFFHQMKRSLLDEDDCIEAVQYSDILLTTIISCPNISFQCRQYD